MHFFAAVVVPPETTRESAEDAVGPLMKPFYEGESDTGWWDWWQIGGRWTGVWAEYDASKDPANYETCKLCSGTGKRTDGIAIANGWTDRCNGCNSTGSAQKWPTHWAECDDDVVAVNALLNNPLRRPLTLVTPDGVSHQEWWDGDNWQEDSDWERTFLTALEPWRGHRLVVVDYHS